MVLAPPPCSRGTPACVVRDGWRMGCLGCRRACLLHVNSSVQVVLGVVLGVDLSFPSTWHSRACFFAPMLCRL